LIILPNGVVSKNLVGARKTLLIEFLCKVIAALEPAYEKVRPTNKLKMP